MLNYQEERELLPKDDGLPFRMATVISYTAYKAVVRFDGEDSNSEKEFRRIYSNSMSVGDRVLCLKYGGTYIVIGALKG